MPTLGETLQGCQRLAAISLLDTDVDVVLLASYFRIIKLLSFVCKRVYMEREGQIIGSSSSGGKGLRHEMRRSGEPEAEQQLTESIEVLHVHATIKAEGRTERDGGGQRREGNDVLLILIFQLLSL